MSDKHRSNQIFLLLRHLVFLANKAVPVRQAGWRSDSKDGVVSERREECAIGRKEGISGKRMRGSVGEKSVRLEGRKKGVWQEGQARRRECQIWISGRRNQHHHIPWHVTWGGRLTPPPEADTGGGVAWSGQGRGTVEEKGSVVGGTWSVEEKGSGERGEKRKEQWKKRNEKRYLQFATLHLEATPFPAAQPLLHLGSILVDSGSICHYPAPSTTVCRFTKSEVGRAYRTESLFGAGDCNRLYHL
ncbi:hypothetical protein Pcinc_023569 [Petrolisthes cinctipes]|uniref:Uncharacterized protein n=1 Tax=Petrolisthes cinctipes TaxID=88211 RepID=A0AAE1FC35_PETCI|nr:hypothetical protein Pcinc_023569 [Petrolisthes cinctipes]